MEKIFFSAHMMASTFLKVPELALDQSEAKMLADAAEEVAKHYDIPAGPKTIAWINLATAMGVVYGPRIAVLRMKKPAGPIPVQMNAKSSASPKPNGASRPSINDLDLSGSVD